MKVTIDDSCSGCGVCIDIAPDVLEMGDDDVAVVKVDSVPADQEDACRDAAEQCPCEAIIIED